MKHAINAVSIINQATKQDYPPALSAYRENKALFDQLSQRINAVQRQIEAARAVISDAEKPIQQARELKTKRRSLLARIFQGKADNAEVDNVDAEIAAAEASAAQQARTREGAEAAIEELQHQLDAISFERNQHFLARDQHRYAALVEYAKEALPGYSEAADKLIEAYAEIVGRCRAADKLAGEGRPYVGFGFPNFLEVTPPPSFGGGFKFNATRDLSQHIETAMNRSEQAIEGALPR